MQHKLSLKLSPSEAADETVIRKFISRNTGKKLSSITGYHIQKQSIDARSRSIWVNISINAFIDEPFIDRKKQVFQPVDVSNAGESVLIVGAGPAGLFAALQLIEDGIRPVILERGKDVRSRRRDLALLNKEGTINEDSNYCFGEGGAGTYSDGKLYTRSKKRGDTDRVLSLFVEFGADENILFNSHPHIGTNKLPQIITAMRKAIIDNGGKFLFDKKVIDLQLENEKIISLSTSDGEIFTANNIILATGHSARDIFILLNDNKILIEAKPFALGVRVEHPQELIDNIQYRTPVRDPYLPPASYSIVQQVEDKGVFSFCMCPGGIIAPAATSANELVVNGWSPSKRNNPYANSGMVVEVTYENAFNTLKKSGRSKYPDHQAPLLMMEFQQYVEQRCYTTGGGNFVAPAQRLEDFVNKKSSSNLPKCSYLPGLQTSLLNEVLPSFIYDALQNAFKEFGKKMKGYLSNEALVVATESRTSSPVRIPRDNETLNHPQIKNLYPCGEGAGYAGGIMSAAMDGQRIARMIRIKLKIES